MLERGQERIQGKLARCTRELGTCVPKAEHADTVAAVQEVARTCEALVEGRAQHAATIDTLAQHAEEAAGAAADVQAAVFDQARAPLRITLPAVTTCIACPQDDECTQLALIPLVTPL